MLSQRDAVFQAVTKFYGSRFENGMEYTSDDKKKIVDILIEMFNKGEWTIKSESTDRSKLRSYVIGLLNNHLRKDKHMNGGEKYEIKNPGSRTGLGDPTITNLKKLQKSFAAGSPEFTRIQSKIEELVAALKAEKNKVEIDVEALPAEFRSLVK